ncbi:MULTISPECIES: hypothetical protein [Legionella]|uniref:Uncharacterized protein n=1 Tax=Legionella impletisoli TaxID=343510 RepID=A0A917K173_9GAMM|nr:MULTISPECIES: hypothetical protein [Legionella]GGI92316.1 hypothetical protein GCM10007966_21190 [Legionella impletisoli]
MNNQQKIPSLYTVKQFCEKHPAFTHGGIRHHIFHASTNGLDDMSVIVRNGRRVLIDEAAFFEWLMNQ